MAGTKSIARTVRELIAPVAEELHLMLWDVEFLKEGSQWVLRVTIDSEDGVTIDDCERMHRAIDPLLDEADPIAVPYNLEVSSPGVERELKTDAQVDASIGETVELRLFAPSEGKKSFRGVLEGRQGDRILLRTEGTVRAFAREAVAKLTTVFQF